MAVVRMNFTMPVDLVEKLQSVVPVGQRSEFVTDATRTKIKELEEEKLRQELIEGYKARAEEHAQISKEWEPATLELIEEV